MGDIDYFVQLYDKLLSVSMPLIHIWEYGTSI